jgi:hypothetical protein
MSVKRLNRIGDRVALAPTILEMTSPRVATTLRLAAYTQQKVRKLGFLLRKQLGDRLSL